MASAEWALSMDDNGLDYSLLMSGFTDRDVVEECCREFYLIYDAKATIGHVKV
jgi:hypothetical protein